MPKLLIISRSHNPLGGADRIIEDLCRGLPHRGWDVVLGLTKGSRFDNPDAYRKVHQNLPTVDIDGAFGTRESRISSLKKLIATIRADVVLSMRVFDAYDVVAAAKRQNIKTAPRLAIGVRAYEAPYISDVQRYRENIDLCVTSGELIAQACNKIGGLDAMRVVSIAGGVKGPRKKIDTRRASSPIRLLYAGRLEQHQKRCLDLIPLVEGLCNAGINFFLDICGAGPEEDTLRARLAQAIDQGLVRMHGWVTEGQLYDEFYPNANCFVHMAAWEGVTISPREAMAHGCVPVISEFTGIHSERQFINLHNSLTFPIARTDIAVEHILQLHNSPKLLTQLSQNAISSQVGKYSYDGALDAWRDALDNCIHNPPTVGETPVVKEELSGRMTRWGVPTSLQIGLRRLFNIPVMHESPGSEWPTASGLMTEEELREISAFAEQAHQEESNEVAR